MKIIRINTSNGTNNVRNVIGSSPVEEIDDVATRPTCTLPRGVTTLVKLS